LWRKPRHGQCRNQRSLYCATTGSFSPSSFRLLRTTYLLSLCRINERSGKGSRTSIAIRSASVDGEAGLFTSPVPALALAPKPDSTQATLLRWVMSRQKPRPGLAWLVQPLFIPPWVLNFAGKRAREGTWTYIDSSILRAWCDPQYARELESAIQAATSPVG
jgi:hypothetical protein